MQEIVIEIINQYGYIGICLLIAIENIFPPIPSEIILIFGGFLTTISNMNVWGTIVSATIGSVLGAIVLYTLGRKLNTERLERLFGGRIGKMLRLKKEDVKRAQKWFNRHGKKAVFFCRFIPVLRSLISIPAGISKMKLSTFLLLTASGTFIWNVVLVYLGRFAGEAWETFASYVDLYSIIAVAIFVFIALLPHSVKFFSSKTKI
ncbi:MAG: DedA family protein [Thermosediminibacteraceae bacterium]|nr:DedA family protein [Thermosediminibacteraceae bacterium]